MHFKAAIWSCETSRCHEFVWDLDMESFLWYARTKMHFKSFTFLGASRTVRVRTIKGDNATAAAASNFPHARPPFTTSGRGGAGRCKRVRQLQGDRTGCRTETKQHSSRARSGHQVICCLVSLNFLSGRPVLDGAKEERTRRRRRRRRRGHLGFSWTLDDARQPFQGVA